MVGVVRKLDAVTVDGKRHDVPEGGARVGNGNGTLPAADHVTFLLRARETAA